MLQTLLEEIRGEVSDLNYQIICQRFLESRSVTQVAEALNLKPEQVRYRQHRLLKKLRTRQALFTGKPLTDDS